MLTLLLITITLATLLYWLLLKPMQYWSSRGVKTPPTLPIIGTQWDTVSRKVDVANGILQAYNIAPGERYFGLYQFWQPILVLRDADLIKQITIKDFNYFTDHGSFLNLDNDPVLSRNLFSLRNPHWREMRAMLTPVFTSAKMRTIFVLMQDSVQKFVKHFEQQTTENSVVELEMRETFRRVTNDIIASTAFGVEVDSLKNPDNEFYLMGKEASDFGSFKFLFRFFTTLVSPKLAGLFGIQLISKKVTNFFVRIVKETVKLREEKGIVRQDMIHLLMEARKNPSQQDDSANLPDTGFATIQESSAASPPPKRKITDDDIAGQAIVFFLAGYDNVASTMCFTAHALAENQDIQDKLREEIKEVVREANQVTYEELLKMKYLDMVVTESLRKYPVPLITDRVCIKPYTIQPKLPHERPLQLNVGDAVWLPMYGIHHDPEIYPNPSKFDPERFNDENKHKINPAYYLTFGIGPRACIGSRFALLEVKILFFELLRKFQVVPVAKTTIPLKLSLTEMNFTAEGGFWLGLKPLEEPF